MENQESSPPPSSIAPELINPNPVPEIVMPAGGQPEETHRSIRYRLTHLFSRGEKLKPHELQQQRDDLKQAASQPAGTETVTASQTGGAVENTAPIPQGLAEIGTNASNVDSMIEELAEKERAEENATPTQEAPPASPPQNAPISSDTSGAMDAMTARMAQMPDASQATTQPGETSNIATTDSTLQSVEPAPVIPPTETQPSQNAQIIDFQTAAARVQEAKAVQPSSVSSETPPLAPPAQISQETQTPQPLVKAA